jgi:RNA polymerase sigma-70 factor (ECF subfamily)
VPKTRDYYPECPEALIVDLARSGDRGAFVELIRRRQSPIRNLMRRCCSDAALADDLAQQVFLKVWLSIRMLRQPKAFNTWLKRLAINVWLQHLRKNDALRGSNELTEAHLPQHDSTSVGMDLDSALATLPAAVRLCVVLAYNEGMSHREIANLTKLPPGTVKSHIRRGTKRIQKLLTAYAEPAEVENSE